MKNKELETTIKEIRAKIGFAHSDYNDFNALNSLNEVLDTPITRMNIAQEARKMITNEQSEITNGMTQSEIKAYLLGIQNIVSVINSIVEQEDYILLTSADDIITEFTIGDILSVITETE